MDVVALAGVVIAFGAVLVGNVLEGGELVALFDLPALVIVVGGTLGAVTLQTPGPVLRRASQMVRWVFAPPKFDLMGQVEELSEWSRKTRREGMLGLENLIDGETDGFRARAMALVVDGTESQTIRQIMEKELEHSVEEELAAAGVFHSMGGYAPTIGILGAVLGLIQVMGNLADPSELGPGIATAFVATIYGVGFANLLFLPVADRLRALVLLEANAKTVFIEGILGISQGEHPRAIQSRLACYAEARA